MKKVILSLFIVAALCFAVPQEASANWYYSVTSTQQIATYLGQPVYGSVLTVYSVDIWNQVTVVSSTIVGPPM